MGAMVSTSFFRGRPRHRVTPQERQRTRMRQQVLMEKHRELQRSPHQARAQLFQQRPQSNAPPRKIGGRVLKPAPAPPPPAHLQLPNGKMKSNSMRLHLGNDWRDFQNQDSWSPLRPHSTPRPSCHMLEARLRAQRYLLWQHHHSLQNLAFASDESVTYSTDFSRVSPVRSELPTDDYGYARPRLLEDHTLRLGGQTIAVGGSKGQPRAQHPRAQSWPSEIDTSYMRFNTQKESVFIRTPRDRPENTWPRYQYSPTDADTRRPRLNPPHHASQPHALHQLGQEMLFDLPDGELSKCSGLSKKYSVLGTSDMFWCTKNKKELIKKYRREIQKAEILDQSCPVRLEEGESYLQTPKFENPRPDPLTTHLKKTEKEERPHRLDRSSTTTCNENYFRNKKYYNGNTACDSKSGNSLSKHFRFPNVFSKRSYSFVVGKCSEEQGRKKNSKHFIKKPDRSINTKVEDASGIDWEEYTPKHTLNKRGPPRSLSTINTNSVNCLIEPSAYDKSAVSHEENQENIERDSLEENSENEASYDSRGVARRETKRNELEGNETDEGFDTCDDGDSIMTSCRLSQKSCTEVLSHEVNSMSSSSGLSHARSKNDELQVMPERKLISPLLSNPPSPLQSKNTSWDSLIPLSELPAEGLNGSVGMASNDLLPKADDKSMFDYPVITINPGTIFISAPQPVAPISSHLDISDLYGSTVLNLTPQLDSSEDDTPIDTVSSHGSQKNLTEDSYSATEDTIKDTYSATEDKIRDTHNVGKKDTENEGDFSFDVVGSRIIMNANSSAVYENLNNIENVKKSPINILKSKKSKIPVRKAETSATRARGNKSKIPVWRPDISLYADIHSESDIFTRYDHAIPHDTMIDDVIPESHNDDAHSYHLREPETCEYEDDDPISADSSYNGMGKYRAVNITSSEGSHSEENITNSGQIPEESHSFHADDLATLDSLYRKSTSLEAGQNEVSGDGEYELTNQVTTPSQDHQLLDRNDYVDKDRVGSATSACESYGTPSDTDADMSDVSIDMSDFDSIEASLIDEEAVEENKNLQYGIDDVEDVKENKNLQYGIDDLNYEQNSHLCLNPPDAFSNEEISGETRPSESNGTQHHEVKNMETLETPDEFSLMAKSSFGSSDGSLSPTSDIDVCEGSSFLSRGSFVSTVNNELAQLSSLTLSGDFDENALEEESAEKLSLRSVLKYSSTPFKSSNAVPNNTYHNAMNNVSQCPTSSSSHTAQSSLSDQSKYIQYIEERKRKTVDNITPKTGNTVSTVNSQADEYSKYIEFIEERKKNKKDKLVLDHSSSIPDRQVNERSKYIEYLEQKKKNIGENIPQVNNKVIDDEQTSKYAEYLEESEKKSTTEKPPEGKCLEGKMKDLNKELVQERKDKSTDKPFDDIAAKSAENCIEEKQKNSIEKRLKERTKKPSDKLVEEKKQHFVREEIFDNRKKNWTKNLIGENPLAEGVLEYQPKNKDSTMHRLEGEIPQAQTLLENREINSTRNLLLEEKITKIITPQLNGKTIEKPSLQKTNTTQERVRNSLLNSTNKLPINAPSKSAGKIRDVIRFWNDRLEAIANSQGSETSNPDKSEYSETLITDLAQKVSDETHIEAKIAFETEYDLIQKKLQSNHEKILQNTHEKNQNSYETQRQNTHETPKYSGLIHRSLNENVYDSEGKLLYSERMSRPKRCLPILPPTAMTSSESLFRCHRKSDNENTKISDAAGESLLRIRHKMDNSAVNANGSAKVTDTTAESLLRCQRKIDHDSVYDNNITKTTDKFSENILNYRRRIDNEPDNEKENAKISDSDAESILRCHRKIDHSLDSDNDNTKMSDMAGESHIHCQHKIYKSSVYDNENTKISATDTESLLGSHRKIANDTVNDIDDTERSHMTGDSDNSSLSTNNNGTSDESKITLPENGKNKTIPVPNLIKSNPSLRQKIRGVGTMCALGTGVLQGYVGQRESKYSLQGSKMNALFDSATHKDIGNDFNACPVESLMGVFPMYTNHKNFFSVLTETTELTRTIYYSRPPLPYPSYPHTVLAKRLLKSKWGTKHGASWLNFSSIFT
ncbi:hypothetical protein SK128_026617 [Halocaridina rubra]|uniref:Uncharacterized protein n=1 Tax=Halocaridina rubra TaxID=373956 RepID=A0AAN8WLC9_HALRR